MLERALFHVRGPHEATLALMQWCLDEKIFTELQGAGPSGVEAAHHWWRFLAEPEDAKRIKAKCVELGLSQRGYDLSRR